MINWPDKQVVNKKIIDVKSLDIYNNNNGAHCWRHILSNVAPTTIPAKLNILKNIPLLVFSIHIKAFEIREISKFEFQIPFSFSFHLLGLSSLSFLPFALSPLLVPAPQLWSHRFFFSHKLFLPSLLSIFTSIGRLCGG